MLPLLRLVLSLWLSFLITLKKCSCNILSIYVFFLMPELSATPCMKKVEKHPALQLFQVMKRNLPLLGLRLWKSTTLSLLICLRKHMCDIHCILFPLSWVLRTPLTPHAKGNGKAFWLSSPVVISESNAPTHSAKPAKGNDSSSDESKICTGYFLCILSASVSFLKQLIFFSCWYLDSKFLMKPLFVSYTGQLTISAPLPALTMMLTGVFVLLLFLYFFSY